MLERLQNDHPALPAELFTASSATILAWLAMQPWVRSRRAPDIGRLVRALRIDRSVTTEALRWFLAAGRAALAARRRRPPHLRRPFEELSPTVPDDRDRRGRTSQRQRRIQRLADRCVAAEIGRRRDGVVSGGGPRR